MKRRKGGWGVGDEVMKNRTNEWKHGVKADEQMKIEERKLKELKMG